MKKSLTIMLCTGLMMVALLFMSACGVSPKQGKTSDKDIGAVQMPNPLVYHHTIDEASKVVGFAFKIPTKLPVGYAQSSIVTINKEIAQVIYENGENVITYRTAKGISDISGDYSTDFATRTIAVGTLSVTVKSEDGRTRVAYWEKGDLSCSVVFSNDVSDDQLSVIIESIQ